MSLLALQLIEIEKKERTGYLDLGNCGLNVFNKQLKKVWDALGELVHLKLLILSNEWQDWEKDEWSSNENNGEENFLGEIPPIISKLLKLNKLVISHHAIEKIENLPTNLHTLYIDYNSIQKLENLPKNLNTLNISYNKIQHIQNLPEGLQTFDISYNEIVELGNLPKGLHTLHVISNEIQKIENLPQSILRFDIGYNQVKQIKNLPHNLHTLDIGSNQITNLENLPTSLRYLDVSGNKISELGGLNHLEKLENLNVKATKIDNIKGLEKFTELKELNIAINDIDDLLPIKSFIEKGIPVRWDRWGYGICVEHCPLESPPVHIVKKGNKAILKYFEELEKHNKIPNDTLKLILIGNTTSGKTSLVKYLIHEEFNLEQNSTHGMQITSWQPEELEGMKINVWDFGGQEYYHATHRLFLSNNAVYILLWEAATNRTGTGEIEIYIEGLEGRQKREYDIFPYEYWLENIRYYAKDSEVFVVQNKSERRINMDTQTLQTYRLDSGKEFHICLKKADDYQQSGEGQKRWRTEYDTFKETLLETLRESVAKYDLVSYWVPIREAILAREENYLDLADFKEICQEAAGDEVEIAFDLLLIYLRDIASVILYYEADEVLNNTVFIKPNWLNQNIYNILNYKVLDNEGEFDDAHVARVVGASQARQFVALMKQFGLIFDLPDAEGRYVAPQYLPKTCSNEIALNLYLKSAKPQHAFTLHFPKFLPKSVMTRFLATYGSKAKNHLFWKYGICFFEEDTGVYVTCDYKENKIRVVVQKGSKRVAALVFQTLYEIIQNDEFEVILEGQPPMLWRDLRRDSGRLHPALVQAYEHLIHPPESEIENFTTMKKIFISYSKHDREKIENELKPILRPLERQGKISIFYDQDIPPGEEWDKMIKEQLNTADIILLMVSAKFLATDYIWDVEMTKAIERHDRKEAKVLPIILSSCLWTGDATPFSRLNALPPKGKPISSFDDENEAWTEVLKGINKLI